MVTDMGSVLTGSTLLLATRYGVASRMYRMGERRAHLFSPSKADRGRNLIRPLASFIFPDMLRNLDADTSSEERWFGDEWKKNGAGRRASVRGPYDDSVCGFGTGRTEEVATGKTGHAMGPESTRKDSAHSRDDGTAG
jgi:hypothetical protein